MDYNTPNGRPLHDVIRDIAAAMPAEWQTVETPHDGGARIVGPDGAHMYVRLVTYGAQSGRLEFSAGTPDGADYSAGDWHGVDSHEMTAAADRDPAAIAREVTRKLIPGTLERHATIAGRMARRIAAANARETLARELAGIMGSSVWERRGDWQADIPGDIPGTTSPDGTVTRTVSGSFVPMYAGTDVTVELRGLTADHGRQLAELIASWRVTR